MSTINARTDHVAQRAKSGKLRQKFSKKDDTITVEILRGEGETFKTFFLEKTEKTGLGETFYATGHLAGKMPLSMFTKKKKSNSNEFEYKNSRYDHLCSQIPNFLKNQLKDELALINHKANINPNVNLRHKPLLDYRKLLLVQYIPNEKIKQNIFQELYEATEPLLDDEVTTSVLKEQEKVKVRVRRALVPAALVCHVPGFVAPFAHALQAKDHLHFFKDSVAAQGMTDEMCRHLEQVEGKIRRTKEHGLQSRLYAELSLLQGNSDDKHYTFLLAMAAANALKTSKAKQAHKNYLYHFANEHAEEDLIYDEFFDDEYFVGCMIDQESEKESDLLKTSAPVIPVMTSRHELLLKAQSFKSNARKSTAYECLSLMAAEQEEKEYYFQMALDCTKAMLSPKAKTARAISLRSSAPTLEMQKNAHDIVLKGPYLQRLQDMKTIGDRPSAISKIGLDYSLTKSMVASVDQGDRGLIQNQQNFAKESPKLGMRFWSNL